MRARQQDREHARHRARLRVGFAAEPTKSAEQAPAESRPRRYRIGSLGVPPPASENGRIPESRAACRNISIPELGAQAAAEFGNSRCPRGPSSNRFPLAAVRFPSDVRPSPRYPQRYSHLSMYYATRVRIRDARNRHDHEIRPAATRPSARTVQRSGCVISNPGRAETSSSARSSAPPPPPQPLARQDRPQPAHRGARFRRVVSRNVSVSRDRVLNRSPR